MAYVVAHYNGPTDRNLRNAGFTRRAEAIAYLEQVAATAHNDGFGVDGNPLDGTITVIDGAHEATYVLSETSDPAAMRRLRPASIGVQVPKLP